MALTDGLIEYWNLNYNSNGVFGNNGTDTNITYSAANGKIIQGAGFNGTSSFINTVSLTTLNGASAFSVSGWVNPSSLAAVMSIFARWDYQTQGQFTVQLLTTGEIRTFICSTITDGGGHLVASTNASITTGNWVYITVVYDGSLTGNTNRVKIYKNGTLLTLTSSGTINATLTTPTSTFKIGKLGGTVTQFFTGAIDEVGIWNRALSADEIKDLYLNDNGSGYPFRDKMFLSL